MAVSLQVIRISVSLETMANDEWKDECSIGKKSSGPRTER